MKRFCITYSAGTGRAEYWLQASSRSVARVLFIEAAKNGELDEPCTDFASVKIEEA